MNRDENDSEKLERQQRAVADLRLEQEADEDVQKAVMKEAARRATQDHWPEMPEDERQRMVDAIVGFAALNFQLATFRRGWPTGKGAERVHLDPEIAGPKLLVRAYATAEADTLRMRSQAEGPAADAGESLSLEDKLRRRLRPHG